jgi:hypothetical protein
VFVLLVACQIQQEFFSSLRCQVFVLCLNMIVVRFVMLVILQTLLTTSTTNNMMSSDIRNH